MHRQQRNHNFFNEFENFFGSPQYLEEGKSLWNNELTLEPIKINDEIEADE